MKTKTLPVGKKMPVLGLGTWELTGETCTETVRDALHMGYRHIDTAEAYGNQKEIGQAIKGQGRSKLFITSKVWRENLHHEDVLQACDATLDDLGIDYLDLYLIHWPNRNIPLKETIAALKKLKEQGKIKAIGVSNFTIRHLKDALDLNLPIAVNQVEYHPFLNQQDLLDFCRKKGIVVTAYSPLARGDVIGNDALEEIGKEHAKSAAQVSLRWLIQKDMVVIPKASSEKHLRENKSVFDFSLSKEEMKRIDMLSRNERQVLPSWAEF